MNAYVNQRTVKRSVTCRGVGVHSGRTVNLTIHPAPVNHGIKFVRSDLPNAPEISAHFNMVVDTSLATVIGHDGLIVSTIEHIMAACTGMSVDNALIELDSYEVPIMDGSAGPFTALIRSAGIRTQAGPRCFFVVKKPIELTEGDKSVAVYPANGFKISCTIDFPHSIIGKQEYALELLDDIFENEISRARTFGFYQEVEYLKRFGLARGGSLDNAVVIGKDGVLNAGGLRYADEFVRHKILDSVGDFSLLGMPVLGHFVIHKSGHAFNHAFLKEFFNRKDAWDTLTIHSMPEMQDPWEDECFFKAVAG